MLEVFNTTYKLFALKCFTSDPENWIPTPRKKKRKRQNDDNNLPI